MRLGVVNLISKNMQDCNIGLHWDINYKDMSVTYLICKTIPYLFLLIIIRLLNVDER